MTKFAYSINKVPIRLTDERWKHIVMNHNDLAGYYYEILETISKPNWVVQGDGDELWAMRLITKGKAFLVIYKEIVDKDDGFIITAFITTKVGKILKRKIVWQPT